MKKLQKRMLALVLSVVMVLGLGITSVAAPSYNTDLKTYLSSKSSSGVEWSLWVGDLKSAKSKITNVKSSKPALLQYKGYYIHSDEESTVYHYTDYKQDPYKYKNYYAYLRVVMGVGSAKLKFTVDNTKCETALKVMNYTNPIKSISVKGLASGKNFSSKFKEQNSVNYKLSKTLANPVVVVTPANGWKITGFYYSNYIYTSNSNSSASNNSYGSISYNSPRSGQTSYKVPTSFQKGVRSYISVTLLNEKSGGTLTCYIDFNY